MSADGPRPVTVEQLIPELVTAGVLRTVDVVHRDVHLVPVGRSHPVWRLDLDGRPTAAVKVFGPRRSETEGSARSESSVATLAASLPALAALIPGPILHAGPGNIVVSRWFPGLPAWDGDALTGHGAGTPADDLSVTVARVAPPLAALHRSSARLIRHGALGADFEPSLPWALRLFDGDALEELWANPRLLPVLAAAGSRPAVVAGLRRARGAWRPIALVHGDLKHDNVLLGPDGQVAVIDWELAHIGDPAWDLAGLLSRPLLDPALDPVWDEDTVGAARALLAAYAGTTGLAVAPVAQRLILFCGAWLLMSLIQHQSTAAVPDEDSSYRLIATAEACFATSDRLAVELGTVPHVA
jgi:hypothetical protein